MNEYHPDTDMFDFDFDMADALYNPTAPIDIAYRGQSQIPHMGSINQLLANPRLRRESIAHAQGMGGVLFGLLTIGLWLKDEVLLQGTQPQVPQVLLPPANYLPNLEADYCKDYSCCGNVLPTLHDLLRHYEEAHILMEQPEMPQPEGKKSRPELMEAVLTNDVFLQGQGFVPSVPVQMDMQNSLFGFGQPMYTPNLTPAPAAPPAQPQNEDDEICIDDPARHLYVDGENKPFKCPVIGCDKTYKNQNGLKYHKLHGHQNQKLCENPDGTFSVIDPESNKPYPNGSFNLEKDKPFRCEVCGKRYKNLNGLKYHRGHSTH